MKECPVVSIPTIYKGIEMRSRLEAQCACLFDKLGWEWVYEPQSYTLDNGRSFTPDFFLPAQSAFLECRGYDSHHGEAQLSGFSRMMARVPGWFTCHIFAVIRAEGPCVLTCGDLTTDALVLYRCCNLWNILNPHDVGVECSIVWCQCCGSNSRIERLGIIRGSKGKILFNGTPVEELESLS